jgi:hypothetical protein
VERRVLGHIGNESGVEGQPDLGLWRSAGETCDGESELVVENTGTLPIFRTRRDADITLACYRSKLLIFRRCGPHSSMTTSLARS